MSNINFFNIFILEFCFVYRNMQKKHSWNDLDSTLCLFTTFKKLPSRSFMHEQVVKNWASLRPHVRPVLFTTFYQGKLYNITRQNKWDVLSAPRVNKQNTPYLREMFFEAYEKFCSLFYAYANGDLLFNDNLVKTLLGVKTYYERMAYSPLTSLPFIIGKRFNSVINSTQDFTDFWKPQMVEQLSNTLKPFREDAIDFFITTRHGFPWQEMPDLVIGRNGFDQYLVLMANFFNLTIIDSSKTQHPVHLMGEKFLFTHRTDKNGDRLFNLRNIHRLHPHGVPWGSGMISSAHAATVFFGEQVYVHKKWRKQQYGLSRHLRKFEDYIKFRLNKIAQ